MERHFALAVLGPAPGCLSYEPIRKPRVSETNTSLWTSMRAGDAGTNGLIEALVRERGVPAQIAVILVAVAVATLVRLAFGALTLAPAGVPFAFYFPALMIVTVMAGWQAGIASILLSILVAWFLFMPPIMTWQMPDKPQGLSIAIFAIAAAFQTVLAEGFRRALRRVNASETRYRRLVDATAGIVWHTDGDGRVLAPQPGWTERTGMAWPHYGGHGWIEAVHPEDVDKLWPDPKRLGAQGYHEAEFRLRDVRSGDWRWHGSRAVPIVDARGAVREWMTTMSDIHEPRLAGERRELILGETRHRLKNLVTIIESLAQSSRRRGDAAVDAFLKKFLGRLHALSAASDLTVAGNYAGMEAGDVIRAALMPFMEDESGRFRIDGPKLLLSEQTGGSLALGVHELATNAIKYGALSVPQGEVAVTWRIDETDEGERVVIEWKERRGPMPAKPEREGFGLRVIKFIPSREKAGDTRIEFPPDGLYCRISFLRRQIAAADAGADQPRG